MVTSAHSKKEEALFDASERILGRLVGKVNRKLNSGVVNGELLNFVFDSLEQLIPFERAKNIFE